MEKLLKVALLISICGIFLLLSLSIILKPKEISCGDISNPLLEKSVRITGKIIKQEQYKSLKVLTLQQESCNIQVTCYCKSNYTGLNVEVIGEVVEYKESLQIQAEKITPKS
ncbi:MAG: hypothetical protein ABIE22_04330 [archaeon]